MEVDLVAQGMFMGRTDGETGRGISGLPTGCPAGARVSNGGGFGCTCHSLGRTAKRNGLNYEFFLHLGYKQDS